MIDRFGDFELDPHLFQLRRGDGVVKLEPKVFDVLRYLVERGERVVTKAASVPPSPTRSGSRASAARRPRSAARHTRPADPMKSLLPQEIINRRSRPRVRPSGSICHETSETRR